jgi:hypothetical protein
MNGKMIKRIFFILILGFVVIFILSFLYNLYDYVYYYGSPSSYSYFDYGSTFRTFDSADRYGEFYATSYKNVATEKQRISGDKGIEVNYDQKYEMISEIKSISNDFEKDVASVRKSVSDLSGVVQMEYTGGLENDHNRVLWISVGIPPSKFDSLVDELKVIGTLTNFSVNKTDKTSEFQTYLAQCEALEKTLESYRSIKSMGGTITDLLKIEEKIIETERELLQMGVTLGIFDESQSLCTVDFTLTEYKEVIDVKSGGIELYMIVNSAEEALGWSLIVYFGIILFGLGTGFAALGGAFIISRFMKYSKKVEKVASPVTAEKSDGEDKK